MAYPVVIENAESITKITPAAAFVKGDLIGYSSGWKQADADAATNIYAQGVALEDGWASAAGSYNPINMAKRCVLYDEDAPYTANTAQYLSGTAGSITETRPTTDNDMIQVVGRAVDTKRVEINIAQPQEWEMFIPAHTYDTTGETGLGTADAGWVGPQVDAASETAYALGRLPSGLVGSVVAARGIWNSINASAFDNDVTVVGAHDGAANNEDTGTAITAGDWNEDADNKLLYQDVSACFDSGFYKPGMNFSLLNDPDGITNDAQFLGLYLRGWKV